MIHQIKDKTISDNPIKLFSPHCVLLTYYFDDVIMSFELLGGWWGCLACYLAVGIPIRNMLFPKQADKVIT